MTRGTWSLCIAVALTACVDRTDGQPYSGVVDDWVGRSTGELIADWGEPTEMADAPRGGKLMIYRTRFYLNNTNTWNYCTTRFQTDKKGKIVGTKIERQGSDLACTAGSRV